MLSAGVHPGHRHLVLVAAMLVLTTVLLPATTAQAVQPAIPSGLALPADLPLSRGQPAGYNADVLQMQQRLLARGYTEVGVADGIFGQMTDAAVRDFQSEQGLVVDGYVGPATWTSLFTSLVPRGTPANVIKTITVTLGARVFVRPNANVNYTVLGELPVGSVVKVNARAAGWVRVSTGPFASGWLLAGQTDMSEDDLNALPRPRGIYLVAISINIGRQDDGRLQVSGQLLNYGTVTAQNVHTTAAFTNSRTGESCGSDQEPTGPSVVGPDDVTTYGGVAATTVCNYVNVRVSYTRP